MIHRISVLYQTLYQIGECIEKRARFGIHARAEAICLEILELVIAAAFETKEAKPNPLKRARIKIEILKRLIRAMHELTILKPQQYINLESELTEISKMTNGWIKHLAQTQSPPT